MTQEDCVDWYVNEMFEPKTFVKTCFKKDIELNLTLKSDCDYHDDAASHAGAASTENVGSVKNIFGEK